MVDWVGWLVSHGDFRSVALCRWLQACVVVELLQHRVIPRMEANLANISNKMWRGIAPKGGALQIDLEMTQQEVWSPRMLACHDAIFIYSCKFLNLAPCSLRLVHSPYYLFSLFFSPFCFCLLQFLDGFLLQSHALVKEVLQFFDTYQPTLTELTEPTHIGHVV